MIGNWKTALGAPLPLLFALAAASSANAEGAQPLECYENGALIFASDAADIDVFDAASYGVTQSQTLSIPEKNVDIYQFSPRDITCFVVNE